VSEVKNILLSLVVAIFFISCTTKEYYSIKDVGEANLEVSSYESLDNWNNQDFNLSFNNLKSSCEVLSKKDTFEKMCESAKNFNGDKKSFFESNFTPFKIKKDDGSDSGLITGYYEPLLYGSLERSSRYRYPVYAVPSDMVTVDLSSLYPDLKSYRLRGRVESSKIVPYYSRNEIESLGLTNSEIICWVDNKIELFFLHIQGSGKVKLDNGDVINIGYANQNGYPYYSIGKYLISKDYIPREKISMQSIRKWLESNPTLVDEVLNYNRSYIFFNQKNKGATGSLGIELTGLNSVAIDPKYIKLGLPLFLSTTYPSGKDLDILAFAQDTGGAIKGDIRADIFFGFGKDAEDIAGKMKQSGAIWVLVPNYLFE
jgi:membrane-bound lytic murein transglycosylase A